MVRSVLVAIAVVAVIASGRVASAEPGLTIALLPLDAEPKLEIYGQPVATEIAHALTAGGLDVAVIGGKAAVPERARLIVDGTITSKGDNVALAVRIRDRVTGTVLDTVSISTYQRKDMESAIEDFAGRVVPAVKAQLVAVTSPALQHAERHPVTIAPVPVPPARFVAMIRGDASFSLLKKALTTATTDLVTEHHRTYVVIEDTLEAAGAERARKDRERTEVGLELEVWSYVVDPEGLPTARAKVHATFTDCTGIAWQRTIVTDTIVGERSGDRTELAARTAREVLQVVLPHVKRFLDPKTPCEPKAAR